MDKEIDEVKCFMDEIEELIESQDYTEIEKANNEL